MSTPLRKKGGNTIIWILMALLVLGLGGFGIRNFGSDMRAIGSVGGRDIAVGDYARALQAEMRAAQAQTGQPVNIEAAQALGLDRRAQARLLADTALDVEAARLGLSVGDAQVGKQIMSTQAFQGIDGKFSRDTYRLTLEQQGMTESEYEARIRDDVARGLLQGAVAGGIAAPAGYVDTLAAYLGETRDFTLAELLPSDLPEPVAAPTDAEVQAYYDAHPEAFTRPETRAITYVWLKPEDLLGSVTVDEAAVRAIYDSRQAEYKVPERRLVQRLVFPTEEAARAARARLDAGEVTFAALAAERGLAPADIDLGEKSRADLGAAGDAVFALTEPGIAGPVATDLGPALFAMNGILMAQDTPFEEVRDELETEAKMERARRALADKTPAIEDLLASGATLEDAAKEAGLKLGTIEYNKETEGDIAGYPEFRAAAEKATKEDFPELVQLSDGGVFALRLDRIDPPAVKALADVRDQAAEAWTEAETQKRLAALAEAEKAKLDGGASLASLGLVTTAYEGFNRGGFVADTPPEVSQAVFTTAPGTTAVIAAAGRVHLLQVSAVHAADPADEQVKKLRSALETQARQGIAEDAFTLYAQSVEDAAGITLNQGAINAVHAQIR